MEHFVVTMPIDHYKAMDQSIDSSPNVVLYGNNQSLES